MRRTESGSARGFYIHFTDHHVDDVSDVMTSCHTSVKRLANPYSYSSSMTRISKGSEGCCLIQVPWIQNRLRLNAYIDQGVV